MLPTANTTKAQAANAGQLCTRSPESFPELPGPSVVSNRRRRRSIRSLTRFVPAPNLRRTDARRRRKRSRTRVTTGSRTACSSRRRIESMPRMTYTLSRGDEEFLLTVEYTLHPSRPGKGDGPCGPLLEPPEEAFIEIGSIVPDGEWEEFELAEGEDQEIADAVAYRSEERRV